MLTDKLLQNWEVVFRREYIQKKPQALSNILEAYTQAIRQANTILTTSSNLKPSDTLAVTRDYFDVIKSSQNGIIGVFRGEMVNVGDIGVKSLVMPLEISGDLTSNLAQKATLIPAQVADYILYNPTLTDIPLSQNIWNEKDFEDIYTKIKSGITNKESTYDIAKSIEKYSTSGNISNNAFRLAFTELTNAFVRSKVQALEDWNNDPIADFEIGVEQYLSPFHKHTDLCDVLVGTYEAELAPPIPRHPYCDCGFRFVIMGKKTLKIAKANYKRVINELGEIPKVITKAQIKATTAKPPKELTAEEIIMKNEGWQNIKDKERFDLAMLNKDAKTIEEMLPVVPKAYQDKFAKNIATALWKTLTNDTVKVVNTTVNGRQVLNYIGNKDGVAEWARGKDVLKLYHATNANLNDIYTKGLISGNGNVYAKGVYFSPDIEAVKQYGNTVITAYVKKPINLFTWDIRNDSDTINKLFNSAQDNLDAIVKADIKAGVLKNAYSYDFNQILTDTLIKQGYNGVYVPDFDYYVIFDPTEKYILNQ